MKDNFDALLFAFQRGRRDFKAGRLSPRKPKGTVATVADWHWLGWRVACGKDFLDRRAVWEKLGSPGPEPQVDGRA